MTDTSSPSDSKPKDGLLSKLRTRLGRNRDKGLRESVSVAIEAHQQQNPGEAIKEEAKSMMLNLIAFADLRVGDVMVQRPDIVAIDESSTMRDLFKTFVDANHSRVPVFRESLDDIAGMIHVKDFLRWTSVKGGKRGKAKAGHSIAASELDSTVKGCGLLHAVLFVPPSMPASDLLVKMQATHTHLAIVVDEYGGTDGLVSIEDLVEEIVGDISDEHDTDDGDLIRAQDENTYIADARVDISKIEELLSVDLLPDDQEGEADTLGGLVFEMAGRVPSRGEIIRHSEGLDFEILDSDPRRVKKLRIHVKKKTEEPAPEATGG